jgi:hypothetical protein
MHTHQSQLEDKRREHEVEIARLQERVKFLELSEQRGQLTRSQIQMTRPIQNAVPIFPFAPQSAWVSSGVRVEPANWNPPTLHQTQITRAAPLQTTILQSNDPNNEFRQLPTANRPSNSGVPAPYSPQPLEESLRVPSDWQSRMQE